MNAEFGTIGDRDGGGGEPAITGDRGEAVAARAGTSLNARIQQGFAVVVLGLVGGGFLAWYFMGLEDPAAVAQAASARQVEQQVASEMRLPPLVRPVPAPDRSQDAEPGADGAGDEPVDPDVGLPAEWAWEAAAPASVAAGWAPGYGATGSGPAGTAGADSALVSPVLLHPGDVAGGMASAMTTDPAGGAEERGGSGALGAALVPTALPQAVAAVVPTRRWLLPKGAFLDCTLETAIDSTLPGMTTCVLAADVFGADGQVVLLERGTKLVGETRSAVRAGQRRVFVLWQEARTPTGVVAALASPGTDALGRAGLTGEVDTHFAERFGAAILLSILDAATIAAVNAQQEGESTVVLSPSGSSEVIAQVLTSTVDIPPTIRVAQGARVQVLVARDVDFGSVYALRSRPGG